MRRPVLLAGLVFLVACTGGTPGAVDTSVPPSLTSHPPQTSSPPPAPVTTGKQMITVTPHTGLHNGQSVHIVAAGFTPNETLGVIECVDKGTATGQGDCDITHLKTVTSDARGRVATTFTVITGPFGSNDVSCTKATPCLVSVSQQTLAPTEEADARISFG